MQQDDGKAYGVTYRWLPDGTDARVDPDGSDEILEIQGSEGPEFQTWRYPSMQQCMQCHTETAGYVLGLNTRQLNGVNRTEGGFGQQLQDWLQANMFENPPHPTLLIRDPGLVNPMQADGSLLERVRSYLDSNCSHCHQPGGERAFFDLRSDTPVVLQSLIHGVVEDHMGIPGAELVVPGRPDLSVLFHRIHSTEAGFQMPPLARHVVDQAAVQLIHDWISSIPEIQVDLPQHTLLRHATPAPEVHIHIEGKQEAPREIVLYANMKWIAAFSSVHHTLPVGALPQGSHVLQWMARWEDGTVGVSRPVSVEVIKDLPGLILSPVAGAAYAPGWIPFEFWPGADAQEIRAIQWVVNGVVREEITGPPYNTLLQIEPGMHEVMAAWQNLDGDILQTATRTIQVLEESPLRLGATDTELLVGVSPQNELLEPVSAAPFSDQWVGYFGKVPGMVSVNDLPSSGSQALFIPGADMGGHLGNASGIYFVPPQTLEEGWYRVGAWMRTEDGNLDVIFGITDGIGETIQIGPEWTYVALTLQFTLCDCYADFRGFQVAERVTGNPGWWIADAEVIRLPEIPLTLKETANAPFWADVALEQNGVRVASWPSLGGEQVRPWQPEEIGNSLILATSVDREGRLYFSNPIQIQTGKTPLAQFSHVSSTRIRVHGEVNEYYALEFSSSLRTWQEAFRWKQQSTAQELPLPELPESFNHFLRIRSIPKPSLEP